jgi:hypothetical protein
MKSRLQNQLNMVGTCITIANEKENKLVWDGQAPLSFATDLADLTTSYQKINAAHALAKAATGGGGDEKANARSTVVNAAHTLARACANFFRKIGDADRRGKVDFTRTDIVSLRDRDLAAQASAIRDIAVTAATEPGAADRGITTANIAMLRSAIAVFEEKLNMPRGQVVNRSTLLKEVVKDTANLLEDLSDLDDLIPQFAVTPAGQRFVQAWKNARIIVDAGHGHGDDDDEEDAEGDAPPAPVPPTP